MSDAASTRDPVDLLAEEFSARLRAGETPPIDEYVRRCPQREASIRAAFASIAVVERISSQEYHERRSERRTQRLTASSLKRLGDFRIIREVGRGGMGIVYEAVQSSLNRRVALKVLGPHVANSATQLARFRREAEAAARLHHTNIVPIYGLAEEEGLHFYAMQFIDGASLGEVIRSLSRAAPVPVLGVDLADDPAGIGDRDWRGVARIVAAVADALSYAHRHGVLHRDIKPANLLLDREGAIWVADFGLAKHEDQEGITNTGDIVGTLRYMAPEQFNGHSDGRSDVYSLGLTLFELLALRPAYDETRHGLLIRSKTREAPPLLRSINPRVPADLETITQKSCATDPEHRYQTAGELAEDLARFLEGRPIHARRVTAPERLWRWCRRNPVVAALCSATFLLLLTVAVVFAVGDIRRRRTLANLEREHVRAETNLALAIRAFEKIIENISARGIAQPADLNVEAVEMVVPETVLTVADAELLETLLAFFDRFANENGPGLKAASAFARKRVGDIQQRLGRFVEAEATYGEALAAYTALSHQGEDDPTWILARVSILNEIGVTAGSAGNFRLAGEHHLQAQRLLEQSHATRQSSRGRFELARTLLLRSSIASRNGVVSLSESLWSASPPGPETTPEPAARAVAPGAGTVGPMQGDSSKLRLERHAEWKEQIARAIDLLHALLAGEPANPEFRLLLARCFREQVLIARMVGDRVRAEQSLNTAVESLDRLVSDFPTHPGYKSTLAEMLCTRLSSLREPEADPQAVERVERAIALSKELLGSYPHLPEYRFLSGSALSHLASLQQASGHPEEARSIVLQAIGLQESLARQFPSVLPYSIALAESLQKLAEVELALKSPAAAVTVLDRAIALLEKFPKHEAARFLPGMVRRLGERRNAIAVEAFGEVPERGDPYPSR